ncbi:MAG TPA: hypothetical protein VJN18_24390 [Polyangiaceae bacterium]|nr:hypothetical protein [Polyangiaceae bacterium]
MKNTSLLVARSGPMKRSSLLRAATLVLVALPIVTSVGMAAAQDSQPEPSPQQAADAAFVEGVKLLKQDRCQDAMAKFRESERLELASGTLLNLAYCEARLGRVASAWLTYHRARALARAQNKPQHEKLAREQADKLAPDVPRVTITLEGDALRKLTIDVDGQSLPLEQALESIPLDPGTHRVSTQLENGQSWAQVIKLGRAQQVAIQIPLALPADTGAAPGVAAARPVDNPAPMPVVAPTLAADTGTGGKPVWALGLTLAGTAAVAAGSALFVTARLKYDEARENCKDGNVCTRHDYDAQNDARNRAQLSAVFLASGVIAAGLGTYFYFFSGPSAGQTGPVVSVVGPKDWMTGFRGSW